MEKKKEQLTVYPILVKRKGAAQIVGYGVALVYPDQEKKVQHT